MRSFLLLHGGSHGAWCWDPLAFELKKRGHSVFLLDLPGHGEDRTPRREITRQTYIGAVREYIREHNLSDFVLVGHSLAGTILPDIWKLDRKRIDSLIFVAAYVLEKDEAPIDLVPEDRRASYYEAAKLSVDNSIFLGEERAKQMFFSDLSDAEASRYYRLLTPQPFGVYLDRNRSKLDLADVRVRYILCSKDQVLPRALCVLCAERLGVRPEEIDAGHDVMLSRPVALADLLIGRARE